jgi:excisionase family DNA binding protein
VTATHHRLASLASTWREEAKKRRRMSAHDVSADVLDFCASEMLSELQDASAADREITVAEFAELHDVSVSTVRRWCQTGALTARQAGREYRIRRGEPCPMLRASA